MQALGECALVALDMLDRAIDRQLVQHLWANAQRLIHGGHAQWKCVDQPVAQMRGVLAVAAIEQHVLFVARVPVCQPRDQLLKFVGR
jgi:hypothetical protein